MKLYGQGGLAPFDLLLLLREAVRVGRMTDESVIQVFDADGQPISSTVGQARNQLVDWGVTTYLS